MLKRRTTRGGERRMNLDTSPPDYLFLVAGMLLGAIIVLWFWEYRKKD
jgi:hypothetical protein